jgi:adenine deaminase
MVTLNPAKLLHLDDRMGSIKEGKDADLVLWSDNPLSIYAKPQWTMIDGVMYYDAERDEELRNQIERERARLVLALQEAKNGGQTTQKVQSKKAHIWHCEDFFTDSHQ